MSTLYIVIALTVVTAVAGGLAWDAYRRRESTLLLVAACILFAVTGIMATTSGTAIFAISAAAQIGNSIDEAFATEPSFTDTTVDTTDEYLGD